MEQPEPAPLKSGSSGKTEVHLEGDYAGLEKRIAEHHAVRDLQSKMAALGLTVNDLYGAPPPPPAEKLIDGAARRFQLGYGKACVCPTCKQLKKEKRCEHCAQAKQQRTQPIQH